jgi:hypothetical protein
MAANERVNSIKHTITHQTSPRKLAIATGVFFLITHVTSIPAVFLYGPVMDHADYILGSGSEARVLVGVLLEVILGFAMVGSAVALYPVVRRHNESLALGYLGLRTLEAGVIAVGVIPLLAIVTLRQDLAGTAGTDPTTLVALGKALVSFHDWTFVVGPGLICPANTVTMAYLLYKSGLVPRFIPVLGLIGGPLIFVSNVAKLFGLYDGMPALVSIAVLPILAWEVTLAVWLITKGFRSSATLAEPAPTPAAELYSAA